LYKDYRESSSAAEPQQASTQKSKPKMQNVAATSNKRSMKNDQNPATTNHTIMTARRPDNIRSSLLVRGRSIRSMARSGCQPRRPCPERIHIFAILAGFFLRDLKFLCYPQVPGSIAAETPSTQINMDLSKYALKQWF